MAETPRQRRWYQISLRTLLLAFTLAAIALGLFVRHVHERQTAIATIRSAGGDVRFYQGPKPLLERWFESLGAVFQIDMRKGRADNALLEHVAALGEVHTLDLSDANIDDDGLQLIAQMPIRKLWLQNTKISDQSAASLSQMTTLTFLQLNATPLSDRFLEQLEPLPNLQDLGLRGAKVTDAGMKYIARHPQLQRLDIYHTVVGDEGVEALIGCHSLKDLGLSLTKVTNGVFKLLDRMPNLEIADLNGNGAIQTKSVLAFEQEHPKCDIEWP